MLKITRSSINAFLIKAGFEIIRTDQPRSILDLRGHQIDPVEAYYLSRGKPFLMDIPIEKCYSIEFSGINRNNPFVETLVAYNDGLCSSYLDSPLKDFYSCWQPAAAYKVDKNKREVASPWDYGLKRDINLADARLKRNDFVKIRRELGLDANDINGHISRGPVSDGFGEVTFNRLVKLYRSIQKNGYKPDEMRADHISASFFVKADDYRVSISSGKHRVSAMQALGYTTVPIQFGPPKFPYIIRRNEVDNWPNVKAGYYTRAEALELFDRKFKDEHPSNWRWEKAESIREGISISAS